MRALGSRFCGNERRRLCRALPVAVMPRLSRASTTFVTSSSKDVDAGHKARHDEWAELRNTRGVMRGLDPRIHDESQRCYQILPAGNLEMAHGWPGQARP